MLHSFVLRCIACGVIGLGSAGNLSADEGLNDGGEDLFSQAGTVGGESYSPFADLQKIRAGQQISDPIHVLSELGFADGNLQIHVPEATFIKVHFSQFSLPKGVVVEISSPDGSESYRYERLKMGRHTRDSRAGDDGKNRFSAMSITGDTAIVSIIGLQKPGRSVNHRLAIDYYVAGYPEHNVQLANTSSVDSQPKKTVGGSADRTQSLCGVDDSVRAVCYESSYPDQYDTSLAVAKLLIDGGRNYCTAWRVGADNRLFTNQHCIDSQAQLEASEVWFDYEHDSCGGQTTRQPIKVTGAQLISSSQSLDYSLFSVNDFSSIADFGHLGIEIEEAVQGEFIHIPQHAGGSPKQISLSSDMNTSGQCQIDSTEEGFTDNTDVGYYCDTRGGSSGSPVILLDTNKVIALHHAGGCLNKGVKMSHIWPQVSQHFGGVVPVGSSDGEGPVGNVLPQASFTSACSELSCNVDAAASSDPDGQIVDYRWDFGDGTQSSGVQASKTYSGPGNYEVRLVVEDDSGDTHSMTQMVSVDKPNSSPVAAYSVNCNATLCTFDAGLSADNDGQIVNYKWSFGDGSSAKGSNTVVQHDYLQDGSYLVTLTVSDEQGASGSSQSMITVSTPVANQEPVANYSYSCSELSCEFNASGSSDPDGAIVAYQWDFGDGESTESGGPVKAHAYAYSGFYTVTLQVEDDAGAISSQSATVEVTVVAPPLNEEPVANYTFSCNELSCEFDASASHDPDGAIVAYLWNFSESEASESGGPIKTHTFAVPGQYAVTLQVEDDTGAMSTYSTTVSVTESVPPGISDITFSATPDKYRGDKRAHLSWSNALESTVAIYKDGSLLATVANSGKFVDKSISKKTRSADYQVCEPLSSRCSAEVTVRF